MAALEALRRCRMRRDTLLSSSRASIRDKKAISELPVYRYRDAAGPAVVVGKLDVGGLGTIARRKDARAGVAIVGQRLGFAEVESGQIDNIAAAQKLDRTTVQARQGVAQMSVKSTVADQRVSCDPCLARCRRGQGVGPADTARDEARRPGKTYVDCGHRGAGIDRYRQALGRQADIAGNVGGLRCDRVRAN